MSIPNQPTFRDPEYLRVVTQNLEFQRIAILRQWETLLQSPMLPLIDSPIAPRVQEIQVSQPERITP